MFNLDKYIKIFILAIMAIYFSSILMFDTMTVYAVNICLLFLMAIPLLLAYTIPLFFKKTQK